MRRLAKTWTAGGLAACNAFSKRGTRKLSSRRFDSDAQVPFRRCGPSGLGQPLLLKAALASLVRPSFVVVWVVLMRFGQPYVPLAGARLRAPSRDLVCLYTLAAHTQ